MEGLHSLIHFYSFKHIFPKMLEYLVIILSLIILYVLFCMHALWEIQTLERLSEDVFSSQRDQTYRLITEYESLKKEMEDMRDEYELKEKERTEHLQMSHAYSQIITAVACVIIGYCLKSGIERSGGNSLLPSIGV